MLVISHEPMHNILWTYVRLEINGSHGSLHVDWIISVACWFVNQNSSILNDLFYVDSFEKERTKGAWSEARTCKALRLMMLKFSEMSGEIKIRSKLEWVGSGLLLHQVYRLLVNGMSTSWRSRIKSLNKAINMKLLWFPDLSINHLTKLKSPPKIHGWLTNDARLLISSMKDSLRSAVKGP